MLLVVDVGNTNTVVGLYEGDELSAHWRLATDNYRTSDELRVFFTMLLKQSGYDPAAVTGCCISGFMKAASPMPAMLPSVWRSTFIRNRAVCCAFPPTLSNCACWRSSPTAASAM